MLNHWGCNATAPFYNLGTELTMISKKGATRFSEVGEKTRDDAPQEAIA
ncbi:MAG: hypothetical protein V7L29_24355 [Nostoc sp.]